MDSFVKFILLNLSFYVISIDVIILVSGSYLMMTAHETLNSK